MQQNIPILSKTVRASWAWAVRKIIMKNKIYKILECIIDFLFIKYYQLRGYTKNVHEDGTIEMTKPMHHSIMIYKMF